MKTIDDYMERVLMVVAAPIISGRPCVVKFKNPPTVGSYGAAMVRTDGIIEVHISPNLGEFEIKAYLHELAHVRLGHCDLMPQSNIHEAKPRSMPHQNDIMPQWEIDADELKERWLRYGEAHAKPNQTQTQNVIWALLDFYKDGKNEQD
jgi:hypothetical protein